VVDQSSPPAGGDPDEFTPRERGLLIGNEVARQVARGDLDPAPMHPGTYLDALASDPPNVPVQLRDEIMGPGGMAERLAASEDPRRRECVLGRVRERRPRPPGRDADRDGIELMAEPDLEAASAFIAKAPWTFATTYARFASHEYTTRWDCRARRIEDDFERFVRLIEEHGYWRLWGRRRWRSLNVDDRFYWLHWNLATVEERTVINRWWKAARQPEPDQLELWS
jgi:hypothetical protein